MSSLGGHTHVLLNLKLRAPASNGCDALTATRLLGQIVENQRCSQANNPRFGRQLEPNLERNWRQQP